MIKLRTTLSSEVKATPTTYKIMRQDPTCDDHRWYTQLNRDLERHIRPEYEKLIKDYPQYNFRLLEIRELESDIRLEVPYKEEDRI